jgi:transglutaminase-like putative cysteine protease
VTRLGALVTLLAGGLALGLAGLIAPEVCLLSLLLILIAGLQVPRWMPWLVASSGRRSGTALVGVLALVLATAASGPGALASGGLQGTLATAVTALALPPGVPIGLLVALAAGALVAVSLELADRRGVQSALVLGTAVLGLASVAAPGQRLLPVFVIGWPAALFTLTRLAGTAAVDNVTGPTEPTMKLVGSGVGGSNPGRNASLGHAFIRWQLLPVLLAMTLSCAVVSVAVLTGLSTVAAHASSGHLPTGGDQGSRRSSSGFFGGALDLSARGPLGNQPRLSVPIDSPRLWRVGTLDQYTGAGWQASSGPDDLPRLVAGPPGTLSLVPVAGSTADPTSALDATRTDQPRTDQARPLQSGEPQVFAPGRLISVTAASLNRGSVFAAGGDRLTVTGGGPGVGPYSVRSQELPRVDDPAEADRLGAVATGLTSRTVDQGGTHSNDAIDPRWTQLPSEVPYRVRQLGVQLVSGAPSRLAAVVAIERELDRRVTYNLDSPPPAAGEDAVDDVLFISHSGFCEQFASAEVVLLRAAGVPARVAVGLSGGEVGNAGFRTLHGSDSHAWVEVWFPGVGWVTSDPTPAAPPVTSRWQSWLSAGRSFVAAPATWLSGLLVLLLAVVGLRRRRQRSSRSMDVAEPGRQLDPDLVAAFAWLEAGLGAQGRGRAPNETVTALARRLSEAEALVEKSGENPSGPATGGIPGSTSAMSLHQALSVLERALYAAQPPSRAECLAAAAAMRSPIGSAPGAPARSRV